MYVGNSHYMPDPLLTQLVEDNQHVTALSHRQDAQ